MCGTPLRRDTEAAASEPALQDPRQDLGEDPRQDPRKELRREPSLAVGGYSILGLADEVEPDDIDQPRTRLPELGHHRASPRADYLLEDDEPSSPRWGMYLALGLLLIAAGAFSWQLQRSGYSWEALVQLVRANAPAQHSVPSAPETKASPVGNSVEASGSTVPRPASDPEKSAPPAPDVQALPAAPPQTRVLDTTQIAAPGLAPRVLQASDPTPRPSPTHPAPAAPTASGTSLSTSKQSMQPAGSAVPDANQLFREGMKYLYGDGVVRDCDRAQKDLRAAARSNPEAESLLGTMYASGHCVGHDLPTAYRWYARALRHEPSNIRIQSDLEVLWNQMTPAEKQIAQRPLP
jgi:hypothetical protein